MLQLKKQRKSVLEACSVLLCAVLTAAAPPNIVIIMADDMGFDDVSFRGAKEFLTPNIDALAYHGKILDRFYVPAICTPSRAAGLTGKFPIHSGMQEFAILLSEPWGLPTDLLTMPEIFRNAGYATNLLGKWHLGFAKREFTPTQRGFDYHYGYWGAYIDYFQRRAQEPPATCNTSLGYDFRRNMAVECGDLGTYVTDLLSQEAERIILQHDSSKPLFLMVNHLATHRANDDDPWQAPEEEIRKFRYIDDPERRKYAAMVSKLDQSVGRIIRALDTANALENTIVIFHSDNGAPTQGAGRNAGTNWPLRGQKNTPWEGGVRVPAVIWSTLLADRSTISRQPLYVGDLLPTLAAAADIDLPKNLQLDGINMWHKLSTLTDNNNTIDRDIVHYLDERNQVVALMHGPWKYINGTTNNGNYDTVLSYPEVYDIDPRQRNYTLEVRSSLVSQALQKFDEQRLSLRRIEYLRRQARVKCGQLQRGCNPLIEECLFHLLQDPCEQNNLAREESLADVLVQMRQLVAQYRASARQPANRRMISDADPALHQCTWTNFLEQPASESPQNCDYHGSPCAAKSDYE